MIDRCGNGLGERKLTWREIWLNKQAGFFKGIFFPFWRERRERLGKEIEERGERDMIRRREKKRDLRKGKGFLFLSGTEENPKIETFSNLKIISSSKINILKGFFQTIFMFGL